MGEEFSTDPKPNNLPNLVRIMPTGVEIKTKKNAQHNIANFQLFKNG